MSHNITKREQFIKDTIGLEEGVIFQISDIGRKLGTNKYNVWIAKEAKKNKLLLKNYSTISDIVDWAINTKSNLLSLDFHQAKIEQNKWHKERLNYPKIKEKINKKEVDKNRVVHISSNGKFFFYILKESDLKEEGHYMDHCIGDGNLYKDKIRNEKSIIISLRDEENTSHATIEIDIESSQVIQIRGKKNNYLSDKLNKLIAEFALYNSNFKEIENKNFLDLINKSLN